MKLIGFLVSGAVAFGFMGLATVNFGVAGPGIDTMTTASVPTIEDANRFMVVDHAGERTCVVGLERAQGYDVHRLETANCANMPVELSKARTWQDTETGKVRITDSDGNVLMRLSAEDRFGWTVVEPKGLSGLSFEAF